MGKVGNIFLRRKLSTGSSLILDNDHFIKAAIRPRPQPHRPRVKTLSRRSEAANGDAELS